MSNNDHDHSVNSKHAPGSHFVVPFVTWGGACSGISLFEMGKELLNKRVTILGAAKILAVHSLMWQLENLLGKGHPDSNDDRMVEELVNRIHYKLHSDTPKGIKLADLAYQSKENHAEMEKVSLVAAKADMPRREIDIHKYFCSCYSHCSRLTRTSRKRKCLPQRH